MKNEANIRVTLRTMAKEKLKKLEAILD